MRIRLHAPQGRTVLNLPDQDSLSPETGDEPISESELTYGHLIRAIEKHCKATVTLLKVGYPPRSTSLSDDIPLAASGVNWNRELVTVETAPLWSDTNKDESSLSGGLDNDGTKRGFSSAPMPPESQAEPLSESAIIARSVSVPTPLGDMVVRPMPDDNSCLFHAIAVATLNAAGISVTNEARMTFDVENLRLRVAKRIDPNFQGEGVDLAASSRGEKEVASGAAGRIVAKSREDSTWLNEAVLGKKPSEYAKWIVKPDSWGGDTEVKILADELGVEMCIVQVDKPHNVYHYRPSAWADEEADDGMSSPSAPNRSRCFLIYSGIHYDVLAVRLPGTGNYDDIVTLFPTADRSYVDAAVQVAKELYAKGYNTDTSTFGVRCEICGWLGKGEREASNHADSTGHFEFAEVKK